MASPHTRLLVADGELDNLQGVVKSRHLLAGVLAGKPLVLADYMRQPLTLPEGATVLRALERIKQHPIPLAVVVDEYGSVQGLVTANDLLAAIAGDLADTRDADCGAEQGDGSWIVDASMPIEDVERIAGITLERSPMYVSLSGLFLHALERLPVAGDTAESTGWRLPVIDLEGRRIGKTRISAIDKQ